MNVRWRLSKCKRSQGRSVSHLVSSLSLSFSLFCWSQKCCCSYLGVGCCGSVSPENKSVLISGCYKHESHGKGRFWATVKGYSWTHSLYPQCSKKLAFMWALNGYNIVSQSISVHSLLKRPNICGSLGTVINKLPTALDMDHCEAASPKVAH